MVDEGCGYISKLSSARGCLYGAKPEETACTTRTEKSYAWREIIDMKVLNEMSPCSEARAQEGVLDQN